MSEHTVGGIGAVVPLLERDMAAVADWSVFAHVRASRWDFWRRWVESPDPVIQVAVDGRGLEVRAYLGGEFSPERANEPPLTYSRFVDALRAAAAEDPALPLVTAAVFHARSPEGEDYRIIMNLPVRTMTAAADRRRKRIILTFHCRAT